jgi:hypothetical protein
MTTPLKHYDDVHDRDFFADENSNFITKTIRQQKAKNNNSVLKADTNSLK